MSSAQTKFEGAPLARDALMNNYLIRKRGWQEESLCRVTPAALARPDMPVEKPQGRRQSSSSTSASEIGPRDCSHISVRPVGTSARGGMQ